MTEDEFLELVQKHQVRVYRHALYLLRNSEDAKDITQETFIRAWEHRTKLRMKTVHSWLIKCTQNLCFNLLKRQQFERPLVEGDEAELETLLHTGFSNPSPDEIAVKQELKDVVHRAIQQLPLEMRTVVIMRELEEMSFKEIAAVLEQPVGTVKSTVFRARKRLRQILSPYWRDDA